MTQKVRIKDVARAAEVSVGTVSHFLNGRFVSAERSARISAAIEQLGFTTSLLAKSMRNQQSSLVGLCLPYPTFSNFSTSLIDALDLRVSEANYELLQVLSRGDPAKEFHRVQKLVAFKVAGLVLVPSIDSQKMRDFLARSGTPTVILGRLLEDETRFDQVAVDHESAIFEMATSMIEKGTRSILFVVKYPTLPLTQQRLRALHRAVELSGRKVRISMVALAGETEAHFHAKFDEWTSGSDRPDAFILSNDSLAAWTIAALRRKKIGFPNQVSVGCLQRPAWNDLIDGRVSFVDLPTATLAEQGWNCLHDRIHQPNRPPQRIVLKARVG